MIGGWMDRDGKPIDMFKANELLGDLEYKRVGFVELANGYDVSTVWLGLDHQFGDGPPLIFETMVFKRGTRNEVDMDRYSTAEEAKAGHDAMVAKWEREP